jgi:hydrogenase nickel incorporation protein HypA/HybF
MHERALLADLIREIESLAADEHALAVTGISVRVGPMSHMTPEHFAEHFADASRGTIAEGAHCSVDVYDAHDPLAQSIVLEAVEVQV